MKNIDINQIEHLYYHEKKSGYEIAAIFGCSVGTIYNKMRQHNLPLRSISEANKNQHAQKPRVDLDLTEVARLYFEERLSMICIGERMGVSDTTIRGQLLKAGYTLRDPYEIAHLRVRSSKFTEADVAEMVRLYSEEELSLKKVAERCNCTPVTVGNKLRERGVRLRTSGEARALRQKKKKEGKKSVNCSKVGKLGSGKSDVGVPNASSNFTDSQTLQTRKRSSETYTPPKRLGKVFEPIPLLSPEEVTPERILQLRMEDELTLDDIAAVCSLSTVDVYTILMENGSL